MSLKAYEDDVIRALGEPRVHFSLNCMAASCPKLNRVAFKGPALDSELQQGALYFFSEARNLRIDHGAKTVFVTEILSFFPEDFLRHAPTLIDFINRFSKEKIPADYKVEFIPYDWKVINSANR